MIDAPYYGKIPNSGRQILIGSFGDINLYKNIKIMIKYFKHIIFGVLFALLLYSCKMMTKIYCHNTSKFDDGEIWGSNLQCFFTFKNEVQISNSNSKELYKELENIKREITIKGKKIDIDDDFYDYAFVLSSKDTLYSKSLAQWRFNKKVFRIENVKLKELITNEATQ